MNAGSTSRFHFTSNWIFTVSEMLFDENCSPIKGPMMPAHGDFAYLQGSDREYFARLRGILKEWFEHYPAEARAQFLGRFQNARRDEHHHGAAFELFLHEVLRKREYRLELEPAAPSGKRTHPDFKAYCETVPTFYLEAKHKLPLEPSLAERFPLIFDSLERVQSSDFFVSLDVRGDCVTQPPHGQWRRTVESWLASLHWDEQAELYRTRGPRSCANLVLAHEDLQITLRPIPKSPERRSTPNQRTVGCSMGRAVLVRTAEQLRAAVKEKAAKYGELDLPHVVAVDLAGDFPVDQEDILEGLFGTPIFSVPVDSEGVFGEATWAGNRDGVWTGSAGHNNGVSAVVVWCGNIPGDLITRTPLLVHNPWARRILSPSVWPFPQIVVAADGKFSVHKGSTAAQFLEIEDFRNLA